MVDLNQPLGFTSSRKHQTSLTCIQISTKYHGIIFIHIKPFGETFKHILTFFLLNTFLAAGGYWYFLVKKQEDSTKKVYSEQVVERTK